MSRNQKVILAHVAGREGMVRVDASEVKPPKDGEIARRVCLYDPRNDARVGWISVTSLTDADRARLGV